MYKKFSNYSSRLVHFLILGLPQGLGPYTPLQIKLLIITMKSTKSDRLQERREEVQNIENDVPHGLELKFFESQTYAKHNRCPSRAKLKRNNTSKSHSRTRCSVCNRGRKDWFRPRHRKESFQRDIKNWTQYEFDLIKNDKLDYRGGRDK